MRRFHRKTRVWFAVGIGMIGVLVTVVLIQDIRPLTQEQISRMVDEINEKAAVTVPQKFDDRYICRNRPDLCAKVRNGDRLTDEESIAYRLLYQEVIFREQKILKRLDSNLTVIHDFGMSLPNNVHGRGIAGSHDHHDASVHSNLADMEQSIQVIRDHHATTIARVRAGIFLYKDLSDVLSHLGTVPHTKSTPYQPPERQLGKLEQQGEESLRAFKTAQFANINSDEYWSALKRGLDSFDVLALDVQSTLDGNLTPMERHLVGRWGSFQSLGPWLARGSTPRRYRPF